MYTETSKKRVFHEKGDQIDARKTKILRIAGFAGLRIFLIQGKKVHSKEKQALQGKRDYKKVYFFVVFYAFNILS